MSATNPSRLPGILLAAGASRRMGSCKLLLPLKGLPLAAHAAAAGLAALAPLVVVVAPYTPTEVADCIRKTAATLAASLTESPADSLSFVTAKNALLGQSESLKSGLARVLELCPDAPGVVVLLGDQPLVTAELLRRLSEEFFTAEASGVSACVAPHFEGKRGNPVIVHRELFEAVARLEGDQGARSLLAAFPLRLVSCSDDACLIDVDKPESYARLAGRFA